MLKSHFLFLLVRSDTHTRRDINLLYRILLYAETIIIMRFYLSQQCASNFEFYSIVEMFM